MKTQIPSFISRRATLSAALCLLLGTGSAVQAADWTGTFSMYGPGGTPMGTDDGVTGTEQVDLASTTPFFGFVWSAHDLTIYGAGTYSIDTIEGGIYNVTVGAGQVMGHVLFDWNTTSDIDVVNVWDVTTNADGTTTYTSTDIDGTGWAGLKMIDGAFPGFSANFDMTGLPDFDVTMTIAQGGSTPTVIPRSGGNLTITPSISTGFTFDWSASDAALLAVDTGTAAATYEIDPSTLTLDSTHTALVTITRISDSSTVDVVISFTIAPADLTSVDTDGDGVNDEDEDGSGYGDSDADGIPAFLDASTDTTELVVSTDDSDLGTIEVDTGALALGSTAETIGAATLSTSPVYGALLTIGNIGTTDDATDSSCVGGCYDFKVTGLSSGGIANIVLPLSEAIPANPAYRKFTGGRWQGFQIQDNDSISSAAALSTGPITCPAPGDSSYSTVGLTPGHYCIQLTMQDNGPNDDDGSENGEIVDPGGVGTTSDAQLTTPGSASSGCSISETSINPSERADWWLVAGFLAALAGLRLYRRRSFKG